MSYPAESDVWFGVWLVAVRAAYKLAYGERLASIKGKRVKSFDDRGLHPYSEQWGRMTLAESHINPWPLGNDMQFYFSPSTLRTMAEKDAYHDFITELREEKA